MDTLFIHRLKLDTLIGVYDWERIHPQTLLADLTVHQTAPAKGYRTLADTTSYAAVAERARAFAQNWSGELLETFCEHLLQTIFDEFPLVQRARIRLTKPGILPHARDVGVELERSR